MLGHELRNPLAPIIAAAELLRRETSGPALARVEIVERQARHLDRLVGDLLDVSRVTTGKVNLRRSAVDLRDVASKAAETARPPMLAKGQNLTMDLPERPAMVDGDETRLTQVVSNLLNNASAYSPAGSRIELRVRVGVGEAFLEVRDEGIGIAPNMLGSIFELFVQGGRSKELAPGGLGLGLGVSRALVELHGGSISASSAGEDLGSAFRVVLPPWPMAPRSPRRQIPSLASRRRGAPRKAREGSCWLTTTRTPPTRWASCCEPTATKCSSPTVPLRRSPRRRLSLRKARCWISACRSWTDISSLRSCDSA